MRTYSPSLKPTLAQLSGAPHDKADENLQSWQMWRVLIRSVCACTFFYPAVGQFGQAIDVLLLTKHDLAATWIFHPKRRCSARADAEPAIVRYQVPPAMFSAPRTRKKAAHP